jgi:transcriptional regulator with XRE-family HTH domain
MKRRMKKTPEPHRINGIQSRIVERTGINKGTVSRIFNGKQKPTAAQAAKIEAVLMSLGMNITRWDMLYSPAGTPVLRARAETALQNAVLASGGLRPEALEFLNPERYDEPVLFLPKSPFRKPYPARRKSAKKGGASNG